MIDDKNNIGFKYGTDWDFQHLPINDEETIKSILENIDRFTYDDLESIFWSVVNGELGIAHPSLEKISRRLGELVTNKPEDEEINEK